MFTLTIDSRELQLLQGDITQIPADAIVNAANSQLAGGGGVDGAIHSAGGPTLMQELSVIRARIGTCPAGSAVVTGAGRLPAKFVFHAVGPIYRGGHSGEPEKLASCYRVCLDLAAEHHLETISFPSISTGVYSYPVPAAAQLALETCQAWLGSHTGSLRVVKLVQFSENAYNIYVKAATGMQSGFISTTSS